MKFRIFSALLIALLTVFLLTGCSAIADLRASNPIEQTTPQHPKSIEQTTQATDPSATDPMDTIPAESTSPLTPEQAQEIALHHAGFTAEQVNRLSIEFERDDRIPHYDVQFHHEQWEYEYEIHWETGKILSYEKET